MFIQVLEEMEALHADKLPELKQEVKTNTKVKAKNVNKAEEKVESGVTEDEGPDYVPDDDDVLVDSDDPDFVPVENDTEFKAKKV
jgi:hypothetical protein